jgi:Relaxase/Mobilisation nuclease domain
VIAKGNLHGDGVKLASYLVTGHHGEIAELVMLRGFAGTDPATAFRLEELRIIGTKAAAGFFHCYVRLAPGERLTRQQWLAVGDRTERALGFTGQPCAMSFHTDTATSARHLHIAWSRIARRADGRPYALDPGLYKRKLKVLSRTLERELGLKIVSSNRAPDAKTRAAERNEFEEARRLGADLKAIRNLVFDCVHRAASGTGLAAALDAAGLILARGDRRDCLIAVDYAGGHHALGKKLTGLTLTELRRRLGDFDRARLPSVDQAQAMQRAGSAARERQRASREFSVRRKSSPEPLQRWKHGGAAEVARPAFSPSAAHLRERLDENFGSMMMRSAPLGGGRPFVSDRLS